MTESNDMKRYFEMDSEINKVRITMGFHETVQKYFKFLIDEYGFHSTEKNLLLVKYESKDVVISIWHDRLSYNLELYMNLRTDDPRTISYSLIEIMNLAGYSDFVNFKGCTSTEISENITKMADLIRRCAIRGVQGDRDFYNQLDKIRDSISTKLMAEKKENIITPHVEKAWKKKNYKLVAKLYGAYEEYLTPEEKAKLEYARIQLNESRY